jgi:AAA15 family ATPase/GTPase
MERKYEDVIECKNKEIEELKAKVEQTATIGTEDKKEILSSLDKIIINTKLANLTEDLTRPFDR